MSVNRFSNAFRFSCLLAIAVCALSVQAQSGRRQTKVAPAAPIPTPTPEPTPKPKPEQKEPELGFLVGVNRNTSYSLYPFPFYDAVLRGCADRLRTGSSARVDVTEESFNRADAIKKAKTETTAYVVLLQLSSQTMNSSSSSGYEELELEYVVFAPVIAKIVTSGRSYQNANRRGPLIVGPTSRGPSSAIYREQLLRYAGEDAADRILKALHLNIPVAIPR